MKPAGCTACILNALLKGATGFDVGCETSGAYRGAWVLVKLLCKHLVANDDNYALAA